MSDDESDGADDQVAALNNIIQPLRKQVKKLGAKLDKLDGLCKGLSQDQTSSADKRDSLERTVADLQASLAAAKGALDMQPWRGEGDRALSEIRSIEKRLMETLDEQRIQLAAHAQVFQATQSTVSSLSQGHASLQVEHKEATRRAEEDSRNVCTRLDHMRGEFAERISHSFSEAAALSDRFGKQLQLDIQKLERDVAGRAQVCIQWSTRNLILPC